MTIIKQYRFWWQFCPSLPPHLSCGILTRVCKLIEKRLISLLPCSLDPIIIIFGLNHTRYGSTFADPEFIYLFIDCGTRTEYDRMRKDPSDIFKGITWKSSG